MSSKYDRAMYGPSWTEVIFGALLSVILGVVVGAALLVARPVVTAKELPKESERDPKAVYYVQGARDPSKGRSALAKRAAFGEGQSVTIMEDELNALAAMPPAALAPVAADGAPPAAKPPETAAMVSGGPMNFRVHDGKVQVSLPVTVNVLGLSPKVIAQSQGTFVRDGDGFVFVPESVHLGSLPLQRLPFAGRYIRGWLFNPEQVPEDIRTSWTKLASVTIEGRALKLTMP